MILVTNQTEFKDAVSNMETEIFIANDLSLDSVISIGYALDLKGAIGASLIWNGTGDGNCNMLSVAADGHLVMEALTLDGNARDVTLVQVSGGFFTMNRGTVLKNIYSRTAQNAVKVSSGGRFTMNGGLITAIDATDSVYAVSGEITMNNDAAISDNTAAGITLSHSVLTMTGISRISGNESKQSGGAGISIDSNIIMGLHEGDAPKVSDNRTLYTCGAWLLINDSSLTMRYGATISDNFAEVLAGGIGAHQATISMHDKSTIQNNESNSDGGGLFLSADCVLALEDQTQISANVAASRGGGIYAQEGAVLEISGKASVQDNRAKNGAGVFLNASTAFIGKYNASPSISSNRALDSGGGIYTTASSIVAIGGSRSITGNQALNGDGGGLFTGDTTYENLTIGPHTLFSNNHAFHTYDSPPNAKVLYPGIQFASTSMANHPLNNHDISYIKDLAHEIPCQ